MLWSFSKTNVKRKTCLKTEWFFRCSLNFKSIKTFYKVWNILDNIIGSGWVLYVNIYVRNDAYTFSQHCLFNNHEWHEYGRNYSANLNQTLLCFHGSLHVVSSWEEATIFTFLQFSGVGWRIKRWRYLLTLHIVHINIFCTLIEWSSFSVDRRFNQLTLLWTFRTKFTDSLKKLLNFVQIYIRF